MLSNSFIIKQLQKKQKINCAKTNKNKIGVVFRRSITSFVNYHVGRWGTRTSEKAEKLSTIRLSFGKQFKNKKIYLQFASYIKITTSALL